MLVISMQVQPRTTIEQVCSDSDADPTPSPCPLQTLAVCMGYKDLLYEIGPKEVARRIRNLVERRVVAVTRRTNYEPSARSEVVAVVAIDQRQVRCCRKGGSRLK